MKIMVREESDTVVIQLGARRGDLAPHDAIDIALGILAASCAILTKKGMSGDGWTKTLDAALGRLELELVDKGGVQ